MIRCQRRSAYGMFGVGVVVVVSVAVVVVVVVWVVGGLSWPSEAPGPSAVDGGPGDGKK